MMMQQRRFFFVLFFFWSLGLTFLTPSQAVAQTVSHLTQEKDWRRLVERPSNRRPIYVLFRTSWCPYCAKLEPIMTSLAQQPGSKFSVVIVDSEQQRTLAKEYNVGAVPDVRVWMKGQEAGGFKGMQPAEEFKEITEFVEGRWFKENGKSPRRN